MIYNILLAHSYLNIAYKYAGNAVNVTIDPFIYAGIDAQQIDLTISMLGWNQNGILCLERGELPSS